MHLDTVYAGIGYLKNPWYLKSKIPRIKITKPNGAYIEFKIGRPGTVLVKVSNFDAYTVEIRNENKVSIKQLNKNLYLFTPLDSTMFIEVWQNYDAGKVILKQFDQYGKTHISQYTGWHIVGRANLEAH